jgi:hypothetical protein
MILLNNLTKSKSSTDPDERSCRDSLELCVARPDEGD